MKKLLLTLILVMSVCFGLFAQQLTYQAVIRDANQQLVVNTPTTTYLTINFTTGSPFRDTVNATTNIHGLLTFEFGDASLAERNWEGATITTTVINRQNTSFVYINNLIRPISAVPYALSVNGQALQNYLDTHHYIDADSVRRTISDTADVLRGLFGGTTSDVSALAGRVTTAEGRITTARDSISTLQTEITTLQTEISTLQTDAHTHANKATLNRTQQAYRTTDSTKLAGISAGAEVNAQSDWTQTNTAADDYIKNKPTIRDSISGYLTANSYVTESTLDGRYYLTSDSTVITTMQGRIATARDSIHTLQTEISTLQTDAHTHANKAVLDRTQQAYRTTDSTKLAGISAGAEVNVQSDWTQTNTAADDYIKNKPTIRDSISGYLTANSYVTESTLDGRYYLTSDSTVITTMQGNIATARDSISTLLTEITTLQTEISTLQTDAHTHANKAVLDRTQQAYRTSDSTKLAGISAGAEVNVQSDWTQTNTAADDYIKNKPTIRDSISGYLTANSYVTESTLDGRHYLTSDSTVITTMQGNIATARDSISTLQTEISTLHTDAHTHANKAVLDRTQQAYRTTDSTKLAGISAGAEVNVQSDWTQTNTAADDYVKNKPSIRDSISGYLTANNYVTESTLDGRHYLTSDSTVITTMQGNIATARDSISTLQTEISTLHTDAHTHANKAVLDRTQQAYRTTDSTKLAGISAGAEVNVQSDWAQTNTAADDYIKNKPSIPEAANDATITIQKNGTDVDNFTVNASTNKSINLIVPTSVADLTDADNYVTASGNNTLTGVNTFSGKNTFSDTVTVPSGFTFGTSPCTQNAVNACDLLTVFDSIQRRMNTMEQNLQSEISNLRDTLNRLRAATVSTVNGINFNNITAQSVTATAGCDDGGATITNYNFCIADNADMTGQICQVSSTDSYTFMGLNPAHTYFVTVSATNLKGTATSNSQSFTTPANKPTAGAPTVTATEPAGFSVEVPSVTTGGAANAEARVCYGVMTGSDCSSVSYTYTEWETVSAGTYSKSVTNLSYPGATYCVKTEIATNNGDSVLTLGPTTVSIPTVAPTLGTPSVTDNTGTSMTITTPVNNNGGAAMDAANSSVCVYTNSTFTDGEICASPVTVDSDGNLVGTVDGLTPGTGYYVRVIGSNGSKKDTADLTTPTRSAAVAPTLGAITVENITGTSFDVSVPVTTNGATLTAATVCAYTDADCTTPEGGICASSVNYGTSPLTATVSGLTAGNSYYVKVSATNSAGTTNDTTTTPATTLVVKPTLADPTLTPTSDGCIATGSINLGGASSATVKVCEFTDNTYTTVSSCGAETTVTDPATSYNAALTGLQPNTTYYVAVVASNTAGNDTAAKQQLTTDYAKPTLNETVTATPAATSISVTGSVTSLGGAASADVKVCAYTDNTYQTIASGSTCGTQTVTTAGGSYEIIATGLQMNTTYYLAVVSDNGYKTDTVKATATTLNNTLTITSDKSSDTVKLLCGSTSITYTATVGNGTATSYTWSTSGGTATTSTANTYTVTYTSASATPYTVSCTANGAGVSATKSVTITSGTVATLGLCETCNEGKITLKVTNCNSLTWVNNANASINGTVSSISIGAVVLSESASIPAGVYTFTGTNSDGCTVTRTATLGHATAHPCTVTSLNAGTSLSNGKYANKEYGTGTQLDSVSDHEGNVYRVVQIGEGANAQCWLAENMRCTTSPSTGSTILMTMVKSYSSKSASYYNGDSTTYGKYGVLYNWCATVDTFNTAGNKPELANASEDKYSAWDCTFSGNRRGICPQGWHIPTDVEWSNLATNAGCTNSYGSGTGVGKLVGGCDWSGSYTGSHPCNYSYADRNSSGFSALPAGRYWGTSSQSLGTYAYFWSVSHLSGSRNTQAYYRQIARELEYVKRTTTDCYGGFSVRCVRD